MSLNVDPVYKLREINAEDLMTRVKELAHQERSLGVSILWFLCEIETRQTHLAQGYSSLYDFAIRFLGYSEGSAHRRIAAARLLMSVPSVGAALQEGKLNLTSMAMAQGFFMAQKKNLQRDYSVEEKESILKSIEGKSKFEIEKQFATLAPIEERRESIRPINAEECMLNVVLSDRVVKKLEKLKLLLSHRNPDFGLAQLIEYLADAELKRVDPDLRVRLSRGVPTSPERVRDRSKDPRMMSQSLRSFIWKKAGSSCEFVNDETGLRCNSQFALEVDHIIPVALGGKTEPSNLRLLCRAHNIFEATQRLGLNKMKAYIPSLRRPSLSGVPPAL